MQSSQGLSVFPSRILSVYGKDRVDCVRCNLTVKDNRTKDIEVFLLLSILCTYYGHKISKDERALTIAREKEADKCKHYVRKVSDLAIMRHYLYVISTLPSLVSI